MADIVRCDGGCGTESPDTEGLHVANDWMNLIVKRGHGDYWRRHRLCPSCAAKNVLLINGNGSIVSTSGFASDVLR